MHANYITHERENIFPRTIEPLYDHKKRLKREVEIKDTPAYGSLGVRAFEQIKSYVN